MDGLGGFILGVFAGILLAIISIAWSMATEDAIIIAPVKDDYKKEILYYIDTNTKKTYKMEIESMEVCKWKVNEVCCNEKCDELGDYPYPSSKCESKERCEYFEKEDGKELE